MVNLHEEKYENEKLYRKIANYAKHLRYLGEIGFLPSMISVNFKYNGMLCIFFGIHAKHTNGMQRMMNLNTKCMVII